MIKDNTKRENTSQSKLVFSTTYIVNLISQLQYTVRRLRRRELSYR